MTSRTVGAIALAAVLALYRDECRLFSKATQDALIRVDAMVEDTTGDPVRGLRCDDFEVRGSDRTWPVASCAEQAPLSVAMLVDVTGSQDTEEAFMPRVTGVGSGHPVVIAARSPIGPFEFSGLKSGDRVLIGAVGQHAILGEHFIDLDDGKTLRTAWSSIFALAPPDWLGPSPIWDAIGDTVPRFVDERGRRAIILVTDGEATGNVLSSTEAAQRAVAAGISVSVVAEEAVLAKGTNPIAVEQWKPEGPRLAARGIDPTKHLQVIADTTGGELFLDRVGPALPDYGRDPGRFVSRALDHLHAAYSLEFVANAPRMEIRVKRHGLVVHARVVER